MNYKQDGFFMNVKSKQKRMKRDVVSIALASIFLVACSSDPEIIGPPQCDFKQLNQLAQSSKKFIWNDPMHSTFEQKWQLAAVEQIEKKYGYLERKSLPEAQQAKASLQEFESNLNKMLSLNKQRQQQVKDMECLASDTEMRNVASQNTGVEYILAALPNIYDQIEVKTKQIKETLEKR